MNEIVLEALNEQIRHELSSAYTYLAMSMYFEDQSLPGFAHWMKLQSQEEVAHAERFMAYVNRRGGRVDLRAIEQPPKEWDGALAAFEDALGQEQKVTGLINNLYHLAGEHGDVATQQELLWFIDEQVEEEDSANTAIDALRRAGKDSAALLMLDREFGARQAEAHEE